MDRHPSLESVALKLCRQALCRPKATTGPSSASPVRVNWLLPDLAGFIAAQHGRPPGDFAWSVRRFIDERTFMEDDDDPVNESPSGDRAQRLIDMSLRVQRAIHHRAEAHAN